MGCSGSRRRDADDFVDVEETKVERIEQKRNTITRVNQYHIEKVLGKGAFGEVYSAIDHKSETVAIKLMDKGELRKKSRGIGKRPGAPQASGATLVSDSILREIATMKRVTHPNCVRLFEVIDDPIQDRIFLVMEYLNGGEVLSKHNLPNDKEFLDEKWAVEVFRDLLDGLEYLHGNGILHRDIKPENMVYFERPSFTRPYSSRGRHNSAIGAVGSNVLSASVHFAGSVTQVGGSMAQGVGNVGAQVAKAGVQTVGAMAESAGSKVKFVTRERTERSGSMDKSERSCSERSSASRPSASTTDVTLKELPEGGAAGSPGSAGSPVPAGSPDSLPPSCSASPALGEGSPRPGGPRASSPTAAVARGFSTRMSGQGGSRSWDSSAMKRQQTGPMGGKFRQLPPVKLLDFGISQVCVDALDNTRKEGEAAKKKRFDDSILKATGTPLFYSPEMCILPPKPFHGRPADVWAAGVTLCMLVSGKVPFEADNMPEVWRKVMKEQPELPEHISDNLRNLLLKMLAKKPEDRPTVAAMRKDPWVTDSGAYVMEEQDFQQFEITDDDIEKAVKRFSNTFQLMKMGKKWKAAAQAGAAKRAAEAAAAPSPVKRANSRKLDRANSRKLERANSKKLDRASTKKLQLERANSRKLERANSKKLQRQNSDSPRKGGIGGFAAAFFAKSLLSSAPKDKEQFPSVSAPAPAPDKV